MEQRREEIEYSAPGEARFSRNCVIMGRRADPGGGEGSRREKPIYVQD